MQDVLDTFRLIAQVQPGSLGAYVITMTSQWPHEIGVELAVLWTLENATDRRRCVIVTHPIGLELRLEQNGGLLYSHASRDYEELLTIARERRASAEAKGWTDVLTD